MKTQIKKSNIVSMYYLIQLYMEDAIDFVKYHLKKWYNQIKYRKLNKIENALQTALRNKRDIQADIIKRILFLVRKATQKGHSKYIPLSNKSKAEIRYIIESEFKEEMEREKIHLDEELKIKLK
jgi:hypothetical protein